MCPSGWPENLARYRDQARHSQQHLLRVLGKVREVVGLVIVARGLQLAIGEVCRLVGRAGETRALAEVVGFRGGDTLLMSLGELGGVAPGCAVVPTGHFLRVGVGKGLLGRVLDGLGRPLDAGSAPNVESYCQLDNPPLGPLQLERISHPLETGVKALDGLLTAGRGQRLGIFAGSGVGKSTLLGMIARRCSADVNVVALVGERGRELKEFIENNLGPEGLRRSVLVVATSDQSPLIRVKAALTATAIAEYFRDQGQNVVLLMDSLTRLAMAQREVGLAVGEPPATKGYPPSVFALLPRLVERAGNFCLGSITAFYTVLVEGDDFNEPIADAARSILDGHIVLSRKLANANHFPAADILASISRLMPDLVSSEHRQLAARLRELLSAYREVEDLVNIGAYQKGTSPLVDEALKRLPGIKSFLCQQAEEAFSLKQTLGYLNEAVG